jgi:hypothetical protein
MLLADGFLYFLDPSQVLGSGYLGNLAGQQQLFQAFCADLFKMRGIPPVFTPLDVPVAVCLPKLDLLVTRSPLGAKSRLFIRELLETEPTRERPLTLEVLRRRSALCENYLPEMFPGWDVARSLRDSFGARFLFFPMTAVSFADDELGETDLTRRTIRPFGILEPLLWLLHMQGYVVLPSK